MRLVGKIRRQKLFPKVKNVNAESPKKRSKLLVFFGALFPLSSPSMLMNGFIKAAFIFWGTRIDFVWNTNWTRIEHELNTNCSRIVQKLMRQLMGINGETFLVRSARWSSRREDWQGRDRIQRLAAASRRFRSARCPGRGGRMTARRMRHIRQVYK